MVAQLDSPGPGSRLFSEPLSAAPGTGFDPLPADLFSGAGAAAAGGGVQTQFLALSFNPWQILLAGGGGAVASGVADPTTGVATSSALTRLKFSSTAGDELSVANRTAPIRFSMPAASAPQGSDGLVAGPVCQYWDAETQSFSSAGTAALPARLPVGHTAAWVPFGNGSDLCRATPPPPLVNSSSAPPAPHRPSPAPPQDPPPPRLPSSPAPSCPTLAGLRLQGLARASCTATPDAAYNEFMCRAGPETAARQVQVAWDFAGDLFCGCRVTVLDCASENAKAAAASRAALAAGASAAAAADASKAAKRRVFPSPKDALIYPAITCPDSSSAVMKIFYGEACAAWRNETEVNPFGCSWHNANQTFVGGCCSAPGDSVGCLALHLTDFSVRPHRRNTVTCRYLGHHMLPFSSRERC